MCIAPISFRKVWWQADEHTRQKVSPSKLKKTYYWTESTMIECSLPWGTWVSALSGTWSSLSNFHTTGICVRLRRYHWKKLKVEPWSLVRTTVRSRSAESPLKQRLMLRLYMVIHRAHHSQNFSSGAAHGYVSKRPTSRAAFHWHEFAEVKIDSWISSNIFWFLASFAKTWLK